MKSSRVKIVIVGGVAGGANVATRARRLSEDAEIVLIEKGAYISFANCGLPYHIGGEIPTRDALLVQTPEALRQTFRIDVRVRHEAVAIDRESKSVWIRNLATGETLSESYDHLVLATGAVPLRPSLPGIDLPGIFALRSIADMDRINDWITRTGASRVVIAGAGFVGLEVAEQLHRRGIGVTVIDSENQVLTPFDVEMASAVADELNRHGVQVVLNDAVTGFERGEGDRISVVTRRGDRYEGEMVLLSIGVRPLSDLPRDAGLEIGPRGAVVVNSLLQTSDPQIWAAGDCVQLKHRVSGIDVHVPLAGPASRAGRLIADNILGRRRPFRGPLGTAIVRVFDLTAACTGLNERELRALGVPHQAVHLYPNSHARYFPGSERLAIKLLFDPSNGKVLGAQAVGKQGADKRIDVVATAIAGGLTVDELGDLDLCYAPPFGSAKDPVNLAGMAAGNILAGLVQTVSWDQIPDTQDTVILDVRNALECARGMIPHAIHIPLPELRGRIGEIPRDRSLVVYCQSGQRSYVACRILSQHGFRCRNLSGSYATWSAGQEARTAAESKPLRHEFVGPLAAL
jgi:NADPH-dependent 2,4-dienoyl-CoA reductase/sulfur reductase-like enzyme/rhodanese-related sulfurtransferase